MLCESVLLCTILLHLIRAEKPNKTGQAHADAYCDYIKIEDININIMVIVYKYQ